MSEERFVERQAEVGKSAARLLEAVAVPDNALVRDAVIRRFEFSFELVWKTGSRTTGSARRASDLDLAISAPTAGAFEWAELCEAGKRPVDLRT